MANLRVTRFRVVDSRNLRAEFTEPLSGLIGTQNITVISQINGVPDAKVLDVTVSNNLLYIVTRPLVPHASYLVTFKSTNAIRFKSKNGTAFLFEDGKTNVLLALGPESATNEVKPLLYKYISENIYDVNEGSLVDDALNVQANVIAQGLHDIGQAKNDNYLEITVTDERKIRGSGPFDRLNEEGAFEVLRVGKKATGSTTSLSFSYESFPADLVSVLSTNIANESLVIGTGAGTFNNLVLTVNNYPATLLSSVVFQYQDGSSYEYDIARFGYQINDPKYDRSHASTYVLLNDNQFKLNDIILSEIGFQPPGSGDIVVVSYQYKDLGRFVTESSITLSEVLNITREVVPALLTSFNLQHAPVVTINDNIPTSNGVTFLDPYSYPPCSAPHRAFIKEIPYRLESLPKGVGEYTVNYNTGQVFVYGAEKADGTGNFPPTASYNYRKTYVEGLDYNYDFETNDLVANPLRELIGQSIVLKFAMELVLNPNTDYIANTHIENLEERIDNRLLSLNSLQVLNTPITNVFRLYNETTGEIYTINRFTSNSVIFSSRIPPRIPGVIGEIATFENVLSETLIVNSEFDNTSSVRIFEILLNNNNIISATDNSIGSSFNSSVTFSRTDIFQKEVYLDTQTPDNLDNYNRLSVGQYQVNYSNGIVYIAVSSIQDLDIGSVNYKRPKIKTANDHILSVSDLYFSISPIKGVNKRIDYINFDDTGLYPTTFERSDERFLSNDETLPYLVESGTILVTNDIKNVNHIFDLYDLSNNINNTDFSFGSTFTNNIITLNLYGIQKKEVKTIEPGLIVNASFISPGAEIIRVSSVIRIADGIELWNSSGVFLDYAITLPGIGSPVAGEDVLIIYNVQLNVGSTPIVDYNLGELLVDYNYLADEIIVSYEYGDNVINFTESDSINEGEEYYVTYKAGALRDSLLSNFGTLVDLPIMNTFDVSLNREIYRDALQGALQSFTKGPTIPAMKLLVSSITKIDPELIEGVFIFWSLGISILNPNQPKVYGDLQQLPGKFDSGILFKNSDDVVTIPVSSNLRLEDGSLAFWIIPEWDGLDNDATLEFSSVIKDGYVLSANNIYIGASSYNPTFDIYGNFSVHRDDANSPLGLPSAVFTQTGLFIYYDDIEKKWNVLAKDVSDSVVKKYSGKIVSSGEVYNVKFIPGLGDISDVLRSITNEIEFTFNIDSNDLSSPDGYNSSDGYVPGYSFDGITFMADNNHYFLDFGVNESKSRFSMYKDGSGYLNFQVWDKGTNIGKGTYKVSADISSWKSGEKHFIGASWRLSSHDQKDEMHLFIDGFEVANILKYGGRPIATNTDRFRTVKPELVAGTISKKIINGQTLFTQIGSDLVYSEDVDFQAEGIVPGDTIDILETGFGSFNILSVSGGYLTLDDTMSATYPNATFSVNKFSAVVETQIDLYSNIAVYVLHTDGTETELAGLRAELPDYQIDKNLFNQNVLTILGDADVGDKILIRTLGLNFRRAKDTFYIWSPTSLMKTQMPPPINLNEVSIKPIMSVLTSIGPDNSTLSLGVFYSDPILPSGQPSNATEGRTLSIRITGDNTNFTTPVNVIVNGTAFSGATTEIISFTSATTMLTTEKWETISDFEVEVKPYDTAQPATAFEVKEAYSVTEANGNNIFAILRFSIPVQQGITLTGGNNQTSIFNSAGGGFPYSTDLINKKLIISSPLASKGVYSILGASSTELIVDPPVPGSAFTSGIFGIYDTPIGRSGFSNGFFYLETVGLEGVPYELNKGYYDIDYSTDLVVKFDPLDNINLYIGSDLNGTHQANAILDELRISSQGETDTRVGEVISVKETSFTKEYFALRSFVPTRSTLLYLNFEKPIKNLASTYLSFSKDFIQSSQSVNGEFNQSTVITKKPFTFDNAGLFNTKAQGTIEFWISPRFDTFNDPNERYYFDASSYVIENITSITNSVIKLNQSTKTIYSIRLASDTDEKGINYFIGGSIAPDFKTVNLGTSLPSQKTKVIVSYVPTSLSGNRISIYKSRGGYLVFKVTADDGQEYEVAQPIFWQRDTWHKIRACYKFNSTNNNDELKLFIDGKLTTVILFGQGLLFGSGFTFGQTSLNNITGYLKADINFTDPINQFFVGSNYLSAKSAQARIDNLKLSNIIQPIVTIGGKDIDPSYIANLEQVCPAVPDAFTTFLMDFDTLVKKADSYAILVDEKYGIFNFTLNIIDSFRIILNDQKAKQILEELIKALKPAQSRVKLNYIY